MLAARAAGIAAFDGVFNRLDDEAGFESECAAGHALGFDGKTLIHPSQVPVANQVFGPDPQAVADARRLIEAATGGAERFEGRMIESMHVEEARALIARADAVSGRSEEHTSELQSLMRISYAVFCLKKKTKK